MNFKKILDSKRIKDSAGEPDYKWLKYEVYHWLFEYDPKFYGENWDDLDNVELADEIADKIGNYEDPQEHGFVWSSDGKAYNDFYEAVKFFVVEINNRGWDYVNKNY